MVFVFLLKFREKNVMAMVCPLAYSFVFLHVLYRFGVALNAFHLIHGKGFSDIGAKFKAPYGCSRFVHCCRGNLE